MIKCKVAIDDKNECTNCCYFCDKKDTCNDVCQDIAKVCEEQVEETDLQVIESTVPDVLKAITDITVQKKKLEEQEKLISSKYDCIMHGGHWEKHKAINPATGRLKTFTRFVGNTKKLNEKCVRVLWS